MMASGSELSNAIDAWEQLAQEAERGADLGFIHPTTAKAQAGTYRRAVKALEIERDTGVAVCGCCFKPFGRGTIV